MTNEWMVKILATGEVIRVYRLTNGNYYDSEKMAENKPPKAIKAGKKEFFPLEIEFVKE